MPAHATTAPVGTLAADVAEARRLHHLATADPEPERDGTMTGPAHESKYALEREQDSAAAWRVAGVHPYRNGPDDSGDTEPAAGEPETADETQPAETATPPAAKAHRTRATR